MKKQRFPFISPLFLIGILLVMLPIFTFMTLDRLEKQKQFLTQRLLEKGISLIQTFEAGTRAGMFNMQWGARRIQTMVSETSVQPEIAYMMITSKDGRILAHSDESMNGKIFDAMPDTARMNENPGLVDHRVSSQKENPQVFEVFKRFAPIRPGFPGRHMSMHGMLKQKESMQQDMPMFETRAREWCQPYIQSRGGRIPKTAEHYIFAGLSMEKATVARDNLIKETVWDGLIFFFLGCAGMVLVSVFQAYRSAKASLTSVRAFSDNVIQNMPSGLVTIGLNHEITSMNKAAEDILRSDQSQVVPQFIELIHEMEVSRGGINKEIDFAVDSDNKIHLDMTASPVRDSDNQVMGFLFLFRDLTQIKELKKQVETNRRLAAIGKLAAGVAHEIRNPLSSIKGFATYFGKRYEDNLSDKETAQTMVREVERINRSISQLLEFAKPMAVERKPVDIKELIAHSLKLVDHDLKKKKIQTSVNINTKLTIINTDNDRINQVLLNLYINAIEALKEEGRLEIMVQDSAQENFIEIRVMDNGAGIDQKSLELIFDPYFTTRSTGTGLGLSIVHRIIENLKGSIRVQSTKGQGTSFIISLPVS